MFRKSILFISTATLLSAVYGCSSSSNNTPAGNPDAATAQDAAMAMDGAMAMDSGMTGHDAGTVTASDAAVDSAAAVPACYTAPTGYTAPTTYPAPVLHQGLCAASDITAFVTACGDKGTDTTCGNWQTANLPGADGGGGSACGLCIFPTDNSGNPTNAGPTYTNPSSQTFGVNYGACVVAEDSTDGKACQLASNHVGDCDDYACGTCTTQATYVSCDEYTNADGGSCGTYNNAAATACATTTAQAALKTCEPGGGTTQDPDWTFIINLICGGGDAGTTTTDAGAHDAATGG